MEGEMDAPDLYHPDLLAYAKSHALLRKTHDATQVVMAYNPYCGDKFEIRFDVDGVIRNTSFYGHGCIVSKASTGLLVEMLLGKTVQEAVREIREYLSIMKQDSVPTMADMPYRHLMVARKYPGRVPCATLAWEALLQSEVILSLLKHEGT
jgi:nitrogen fixation NifU-like protein